MLVTVNIDLICGNVCFCRKITCSWVTALGICVNHGSARKICDPGRLKMYERKIVSVRTDQDISHESIRL